MRKHSIGHMRTANVLVSQLDASALSDQGLRRPLTESSDITKYMNGEQRPGWYFGHAQDDLKLRILRVFEGNFSLNAAHLKAQGPVVQSIVSLTISLMTNSLTVVAEVFINTLIFLLQKCE